ncbi:hypothetical protein MLD38_009831 [Melastoma candidum]|uniref:Uncharacterized protein n=1 Tax=Melastoma candidum TaxID=119954 RepID=A0ACB9S034_9MYRT|nr:hypothetical protein MLD38_009831 [Melastoma candidum]
MQGNLFNGSIPSLSGLRGLQFLDLSSNNLSGAIPQYITTFDGMQFLNLSFNHLNGEVPSGGIFRNSSAIDIRRNGKLCTLCCLGILLWLRKSNKEKRSVVGASFSHFLLKVSYNDLLDATNGFSSQNLLGSGAFGRVYRAILDTDEKPVAVKVLNLQQKGALKSFIAECEALQNIRHRNLVKVLTACSSIDPQGNEFKALVYAFMENGSLDSWLHRQIDDVRPRRHLGFLQRLNIAINVASALEYLHHMCPTSLVHCDLKPSNVLLDNEMTAHLSDFGLARLLYQSGEDVISTMSSSSTIRGTNGYMAPEYGMGYHPSTAGDVYSFGVLLLEIFTGKRPTDDMFYGKLDLRSYVKQAWPEKVTKISDPSMFLGNEGGMTQQLDGLLVKVFHIGIVCTAELPRDRKNMLEVTAELNKMQAQIPCGKDSEKISWVADESC